MTKSINVNHTDTAVDGVPSLSLPISVLNYGVDFRKTKDEPNEAIITNLTSPIGKPEKFRIAITEVPNVYKKANLDPGAASSTRGTQLLVQLTEVLTITDSVDATYEVNVPLEGHIVLTIPQEALVTADMLKVFLGRLAAGFFSTGSIASDRITSLQRGSLLPSDI